jgi:hypothetical protein
MKLAIVILLMVVLGLFVYNKWIAPRLQSFGFDAE